MKTDAQTSINPGSISRFKKERFLLKLNGEKLRSEIVTPLFIRQGLKNGKEFFSPINDGNISLFIATDNLGLEDLYVVICREGNINLAQKAKGTFVEAIAKLRDALQLKLTHLKSKQKKSPAKIILCSNGKINDHAREKILKEVNDTRVVFLDSQNLISKIDEIFPEVWFGIDVEIAPYFRKLKSNLEDATDNLAISDVLPRVKGHGAATEEGYIPLRLYRTVLRPKKEQGQVRQEPEFQQIPVTGILNKRERLVLIIGEAGFGKSTSIKRLAHLLVKKGLDFEENLRIPILLRALDLANKSEVQLVTICAEETEKVTGTTKPSFTNTDLLAGRVTVFIDALDELPSDECRAQILDQVAEFHELYPRCQVIVTSRDYAFTKTLAGLQKFTPYRITPINYQQAQKIVDTLQRTNNLPHAKSKEILRRLQAVHGIELTPLLVTVFAAISDYTRQDIPANVTELFKKYTEMMLGRWDANKGFAHQYHAPLKDFILTQVAFEMHRRQETKISLTEFDSIIEVELDTRGHKADLAQLSEEIVHRSGLFRIVDDSIEFRHFLLQEFFAGRGIPSIEFLETVVSDEWWQRAIVFYFGEHPNDGRGLDAVRKSLLLRPAEEVYQAARTLGLALQACYLVELRDKIEVYRWVIEGLAGARELHVENAADFEISPLRRFIFYCLLGRESVALSVLEPKLDEIIKPWHELGLAQDEIDLRMFWVITGLIESGHLAKAEELTKTFYPRDGRLILGIHFECMLLQHLRIGTTEQLAIAERITISLEEQVQYLRAQLLKEVKTELLEIQQGELKDISQHALTE